MNNDFYKNRETAVKNCLRVFKYPPSVFNDLYLDDIDEQGLFFLGKEAAFIVNSMGE